MTAHHEADVLIIGGGPAGLTAARELRRLGVADVTVLDRENAVGGIPRHSDHTGYGLRDLHRVMSGPQYAKRLAGMAMDAGAQLQTSSTVTGWRDDHTVWVTSPQGRTSISARAVLLATGARERPRAARMIPGDRPSGVMNTGQLQNLVHLQHRKVGSKAVVVGAELVSWSAVLTLREAGCDTVLMTTPYDRPETYAVAAWLGRAVLRVPVACRTQVTRILGKQRVRGVEVTNLDTGQVREVECDTVILTGDWIPDNELARMRGLVIDAGSRSPVVDTALRTSVAGIFGAGNLLHPVDTADVASLDGKHVAQQIAAYLEQGSSPDAGVRIVADQPFRWIAPAILRSGDPAPPRKRFLLWSDEHVVLPTIIVRQAGEVIAQERLAWPVAPGRVFRVPSSVFRSVRMDQGDVTVGLA